MPAFARWRAAGGHRSTCPGSLRLPQAPPPDRRRDRHQESDARITVAASAVVSPSGNSASASSTVRRGPSLERSRFAMPCRRPRRAGSRRPRSGGRPGARRSPRAPCSEPARRGRVAILAWIGAPSAERAARAVGLVTDRRACGSSSAGDDGVRVEPPHIASTARRSSSSSRTRGRRDREQLKSPQRGLAQRGGRARGPPRSRGRRAPSRPSAACARS